MSDFNKRDSIESEPVLKAGRSKEIDFRSRKIGSAIKTFAESLPSVDTQAVIGNDNSRVKVTSVGKDEFSTGYFASLQKKQPTFDAVPPAGLVSNIPLLGINGGPKVRISKILRDDFFSIFSKRADASKNTSAPQSLSADTLSYIKPLLDIIALARKTSATYMPILQVTFAEDAESGIKSVKTWQWFTTNGTDRLWYEPNLSIPELSRFLNCSEADLATAFYILQADKDISYLAFQLQIFMDLCFNNYDKLYQVFYNHRDVVRLIYAYTRRSAVQKPVLLCAQILKNLKLVSGKFYNNNDFQICRMQQERVSSSSTINLVDMQYSQINKMTLIAAGASRGTVYAPFPWILPKVNAGGEQTSRFEIPAVGCNPAFSCYVDQIDYYTFFKAIQEDDLEAATAYIDKIVANIKEITPKISTKYSSILALSSESGVDLNLTNVDLPLLIDKEPYNPAYHEFVDSASSSSYSTYIRDERHPNNERGEFSRWFQQPEYIIENQTVTFRTSVNYDGNYSSLLNSNMFIKNVPAIHDHTYHSMYPSGICIIFSSYYNAEMFGYSDNFSAKSNIDKFSSDYKKFISYFQVRSLGFKYSVTASTHKVSFVARPNVMLEDVIMTTPDIDMTYQIGYVNSPYSKVKEIG